MNRRPVTLPRLLMYVAVAGVLIGNGIDYVRQPGSGWKNAIMAGEVRGDKRTLIYHVPTCPGYDSVSSEDLQPFVTVNDAEIAGYRGAYNCGEAIDIRQGREANPTSDDEPDHDGPR
jgi:hypothetical protein